LDQCVVDIFFLHYFFLHCPCPLYFWGEGWLLLLLIPFVCYQIVLEADGYQPYLISPEKGLRSLIKGVLELAKEPSRLCVDEVML